MRRFLLILLAAVLLLPGCKAAHGVIVETRETVKVINHTELVPVTVTLDLPHIIVQHTVKDSTSHLETNLARSDAHVGRDGTLTHSLENIPQQIEQQTYAKIEYRDSIIYKEKQVPIYIEKQLTKWQQIKMEGFWYLLLILVIVLLASIIRIAYGRR